MDDQKFDIIKVANYFHDHPIMLVGAGISALVMAVCCMIEKEINN